MQAQNKHRNIFDDLLLFSECIIGFNFGLGIHEIYEMLATVFGHSCSPEDKRNITQNIPITCAIIKPQCKLNRHQI